MADRNHEEDQGGERHMKTAGDGRLRVALKRLLSRYPLLGGLVATWDLRAEGTDTMAVGMDDQAFVLYYCPDFLARIRIDRIVGVLHHEARHVLYGHVMMDPADFPDKEALVTAQEVTVNEGLPEPLPAGAIRLKDFPTLPRDEDTLTRYRRLRKGRRKKRAKRGKSQQNGPGKRQQSGRGKPACRKRWKDDHGHWREIRDRDSYAKNLMDVTVRGILDECRPSVQPEDRATLERACQAWGIEPGKELSQLPDARGELHVNWRLVLRRHVGRLLAKRAAYSRPPRRFPKLLGIVPGTAMSATKPLILSVVDTSASMTDKMLGAISNELRFLTRDHCVMVVECDCEIQAVYRYRQPIVSVMGRGGTDFRPPLERAFLREHAADLVVFFTDGFGPAPDRSPYIPVIWVLTPDGERPAPWGAVIQMAAEPDEGG